MNSAPTNPTAATIPADVRTAFNAWRNAVWLALREREEQGYKRRITSADRAEIARLEQREADALAALEALGWTYTETDDAVLCVKREVAA